MKTLWIAVGRQFVFVFLLALVFFMMILELADLFANLWTYLGNDASTGQIFLTQLYYAPKCFSYSLPVSLLFAISFTLGSMYANNELIAIFASGISLRRLLIPLIVFGAVCSIFSYYFQENVVIDTFKQKNQMEDNLLQRRASLSNANVTVIGGSGTIIYHADFYNDATQTLSGLTVLLRGIDGAFSSRIDAQTAVWSDGHWVLRNVRIVAWNGNHTFLVQDDEDAYSSPSINESPDTFKRTVRDVDEMEAPEARRWIASLKRAGLPYRAELTDYYSRFTFALTPFIVSFISSAIGGRFRKNILLMSLLSSLVISVVYYVIQMMAVLLAKLGYVSPLTGASTGAFLFLVAGTWLFRQART